VVEDEGVVVAMTKVEAAVDMVIKVGKVVGMAVEDEVVGTLVEAKVNTSMARAITVARLATRSLTVVQRRQKTRKKSPNQTWPPS
jgi:hypothetical protein